MNNFGDRLMPYLEAPPPHCRSGDTATPYLVNLAPRRGRMTEAPLNPDSKVWARLLAFSSNFLAVGDEWYSGSHNRTSIMPVDTVVGIAEPTFGKYHTS